MFDLEKAFWNANGKELKQGFIFNNTTSEYCCLLCGNVFSKGIIYPHGEQLFDAKRAVRSHIRDEHGSMFDYLLNFNDKYTGLTSHQKKIIRYFYEGLNDKQIIEALGGGSTSTIRNHRFALKEKEKQARIFLTLMELLKERSDEQDKFIPVPRSSPISDERFALTEEEYNDFIGKYFTKGKEGPLTRLPKQEKRRIAILQHLIKRFDRQKRYSETEINAILKAAYEDYVLLRRYMIDYGFMKRMKDGSAYWLNC